MRIPRIEAITAVPLAVPLREPFVIASGRVDATHAVLVRVRVAGTEGLGEAACLPGVTTETPATVLDAIAAARGALVGAEGTVGDLLASGFGDASPVARSGVECAILDAAARLRGTSVRALLAPPGAAIADELETDITIPILGRETMVELAVGWRRRGFTVFKVKVGLDWEHDVASLVAIHDAVPDARLRVDANGAYSAEDALRLSRETARHALRVECFEQPCARADLDGMARVTREAGIPVVADESVQSLADLDRLIARGAATGVNLKIAKMGGLLDALAIGRRARASGLRLMVGGMVETRLGMTAAMHVASALGGCDWCDMDTAFLLAEDPFRGGYEADGPRLHLSGPGLGVTTVGDP